MQINLTLDLSTLNPAQSEAFSSLVQSFQVPFVIPTSDDEPVTDEAPITQEQTLPMEVTAKQWIFADPAPLAVGSSKTFVEPKRKRRTKAEMAELRVEQQAEHVTEAVIPAPAASAASLGLPDLVGNLEKKYADLVQLTTNGIALGYLTPDVVIRVLNGHAISNMAHLAEHLSMVPSVFADISGYIPARA